MKIDLKEMLERTARENHKHLLDDVDEHIIVFYGYGQLLIYVGEVLNEMQKELDKRIKQEEAPMPELFFPKDGECYYFINTNMEIWIAGQFWRSDAKDVMRAKLGNCFKTKEELEKLTLGQKKKLWDKFYKLGE